MRRLCLPRVHTLYSGMHVLATAPAALCPSRAPARLHAAAPRVASAALPCTLRLTASAAARARVPLSGSYV